jgi:hypothetical protein
VSRLANSLPVFWQFICRKSAQQETCLYQKNLLPLAFHLHFANLSRQITENQREVQLLSGWKVGQCEQKLVEEVKQ